MIDSSKWRSSSAKSNESLVESADFSRVAQYDAPLLSFDGRTFGCFTTMLENVPGGGHLQEPTALHERFPLALELALNHFHNQHLLLVSGSESTFITKFRRDTLRSAGYRTTHAEGLSRAVALGFSLRPDLIILEESFTERERTAFIELLHEDYPCMQVVSLHYGDVQPEALLKACRNIFSAQPGGRTVHAIKDLSMKKSA